MLLIILVIFFFYFKVFLFMNSTFVRGKSIKKVKTSYSETLILFLLE